MNAVDYIHKEHGVVMCPCCMADLYFVKNWRDITKESVFEIDHLVSLNGDPLPKALDKITCPRCEAPLVWRKL